MIQPLLRCYVRKPLLYDDEELRSSFRFWMILRMSSLPSYDTQRLQKKSKETFSSRLSLSLLKNIIGDLSIMDERILIIRFCPSLDVEEIEHFSNTFASCRRRPWNYAYTYCSHTCISVRAYSWKYSREYSIV